MLSSLIQEIYARQHHVTHYVCLSSLLCVRNFTLSGMVNTQYVTIVSIAYTLTFRYAWVCLMLCTCK